MHSSKKIHPYAHPKLLKDFLREELGQCAPRKSSSVLLFLETVLAKAFKVVSRSRQAFPFGRSLHDVFKTKDIARKTSLWGMAEEMPRQQSGSSCNTSSSGTGDGNYGSSCWHESSFDEELSPTWWEFVAQKHASGSITRVFESEETSRSFAVTEKKDKGQLDSPVSVIGFWFGNEEEVYVEDLSKGVDKRLSIVREDRGRHLLSRIKLVHNPPIISEPHVKKLLLDFFASELPHESPSDGLEQKAMDVSTSWIKGELYSGNEWAVGGRKDVYVEEMEDVGGWSGFMTHEKEEMMIEAEGDVLDGLIREMVVDIGLAYLY